jgi:hypothetical protein
LRDGATDFLLKMDTVEKISKRIQQTPEQGAESVPGLGWGNRSAGGGRRCTPGQCVDRLAKTPRTGVYNRALQQP